MTTKYVIGDPRCRCGAWLGQCQTCPPPEPGVFVLPAAYPARLWPHRYDSLGVDEDPRGRLMRRCRFCGVRRLDGVQRWWHVDPNGDEVSVTKRAPACVSRARAVVSVADANFAEMARLRELVTRLDAVAAMGAKIVMETATALGIKADDDRSVADVARALMAENQALRDQIARKEAGHG